MNLRELHRHLLASAIAGNSVLVESKSGIGKSSMMLKLFESLKAQDPSLSWGLCCFFAATQTPPDLIGYQFKGDRSFPMPDGTQRTITVTDPSVPLWMISTEGKPAFMYDRVLLVIEEYGQGEADVKRACAEIFLNGGTSPWYLPQGSMVVGLTNKGARYGVSKDFDFCIARRTLVTADFDIDVWLEDFADKPYLHKNRVWNTMPITKVWAKNNAHVVNEDEPKEQGPWCNPRTLCSFDRYLQVMTGFNNGVIPHDDIGVMSYGTGTIGAPASQSFVGMLQFRTELPSYESVVADPTGTPVPKRADLLLLMAYELANLTKKEHIAECITYVKRLPKDMAVTYVSSMLRRDYKGLINEPPMQAWIQQNAPLLAAIQHLTA